MAQMTAKQLGKCLLAQSATVVEVSEVPDLLLVQQFGAIKGRLE
jgi:hypothetical protein